MKRRGTTSSNLSGDRAATPEKADYLLEVARDEFRKLGKQETPRNRAHLRQIANKAWMALATGADAYLCSTKGSTVKNRSDVVKVYKSVSSEAAGLVDNVYNVMHIDCGYEDRPSCTRAAVQLNFRLAGQALTALKKHTAKRGKKVCKPWK